MDQLKLMRETCMQIFWSLLLQGVGFIVLAVLIVLYPALLIALVATMFLFIGVVLIALALRLHKLWKKVPSFLKD